MSDVDAMSRRGGRPPAVPVPHKVVPCRYFLQGKCHRGAACTFKHIRPDGSEVCEPVRQAPKPPVVKVLKKPRFDLTKLMEMYSGDGAEDSGAAMDKIAAENTVKKLAGAGGRL